MLGNLKDALELYNTSPRAVLNTAPAFIGGMRDLVLKAEELVDRSIPFLVLLLLAIIVAELFFSHEAEPYHAYVELADWLIIGVFTLDLVFKYNRVRDVPDFIRRYWIDILAVFPFYLAFRVLDEAILIAGVAEAMEGTQPLFHEATELEKAGSKVAKEAEATGKIVRFEFLGKLFRPLQRFPRLLKGLAFYESPGNFKSLKRSLQIGRL